MYQFIRLLFKPYQMVSKLFWLLSLKYGRKIKILKGLLRFINCEYKFKSYGSKCSLGKNVDILGKLEIHLGHQVVFRNNVLIRGNGKLDISDNTVINQSSIITSMKSIKIGRDCMIAPYTYIIDTDHKFDDIELPIREQGYLTGEIIIGNDVWIGTHCIILKGTKIGDGSIIAANSVVKGIVEPYTIYGGSPAKKIKNRIEVTHE